MFFELLVSLLICDVNPADPTGKTIYPSGIHDCDEGFMSLPSSKCPVLKISVPIIDMDGKIVYPGMYGAMLNKKQIFLIQSGEIKAVLSVTVTKSLPQQSILTEAKAVILDSEYVLVTFKENLSEAQSIVRISRYPE